MFNQIRLKHFRQHKDLSVSFDNGMIALRGENEKGKTTLLEGISYAMGGARMLREPLSEVVTWGEKETSLKVEMDFTVNGVTYRVTRGKSGAEIRTSERIEATGQDEVTRFIEALIGCPIKTATQLMLANQQKLRGTLEEDGAAVKLIEQLADFQLIDRIVALVQKHLPCGTTGPVEASISTLETQLAEPLVDDTGPFVDAVAAGQQVMDAAGETYHLAKEAYDALQEPARQAQQRLDRRSAGVTAVEAALKRLETAKATFAAIQPVPGPSDEEIAELRRQYADEGRIARAVTARRALQTVPEPVWEGPYEDLLRERSAMQSKRAALDKMLTDVRVNIRGLQAGRINQTACGLCGKDLSQVPEVAKKNADIDRQIMVLQSTATEYQQELVLLDADCAQYEGVVNDGLRADRVFQQYAEFITLDRNYTPAKWEWIGPDTDNPPKSVANDLTAAVNKQQLYQRELGRQQQAQSSVTACEKAYEDACEERDAAFAAVGDAVEVLEQAAAATQTLYTAEQEFRNAEQAVQRAENDLSVARRMLEMRQQARRQVEEQLAATKKMKADMDFNNELVNALRKARPSIVEELWNIVSATVSHTFSAIRGVQSTFVRNNDSFTVDGRGIKGLSGSTLDALGLAIRMSLTKTFLPNTRFLVLDEPAAACDEGREMNMLGVIAASEFDQIIMVTHSDLADTFASQVVRL